MNEPLWWQILNIEDSQFERSEILGGIKGKFRLKDIGILHEMAPGIYKSAAEEVKEYSDFLAASTKNVKKVKLGRRLGVIPMLDATLHPELMSDPKAQDKYWSDNPQYKIDHPGKYV